MPFPIGAAARPPALLALLVAATLSPAAAADIFQARIEVDGRAQTISASNAERFIDQLSSDRLRALFPNYTDRSAARAEVSLRGIAGTVSYEADSTRLRLQVPAAGIDQTFAGTTRGRSEDQLQDFAKGEAANAGVPTAALQGDARGIAEAVQGSRAITRLLRYAVSDTPLDPVAGNPTSLLSRMVAADYENVVTPTVPGTASWRMPAGLHYGVTGQFLGTSAGDYRTRLYEVSTHLAYNFANGDGLLADLPVVIEDVQGSAVYQASLGLGYRWQVPGVANWTLTPQARFGFAGSIDAGALGGIARGSVTSALRFDLGGDTALTVGNAVGYGETVPIALAGYRISYDIANLSFRNGLILTRALGSVGSRQVDGSLSFTDTRFAGDRLYVGSYQEYGVSLSLRDRVAANAPAPLRIGASFLSGEHNVRGVLARVSVQF